MPRVAILAVAFLVLGGLATAQVPTSGNVFFGYSYYNTDLSPIDRANTSGWQGSLEGKVLPWVGIVADFDGHYGSQNFPVPCPPNSPCVVNVDVTEHNVLFGPRVSTSIGKFRPFGEVLIGVGHVHANGFDSDTSFASAFGGGIDYHLVRPLAVRVEGDYVSTRFFGTTQNNLRLSTGIVFHF